VAALDVGVEGRAHRLDARDDDPLHPVRELEPLGKIAIELTDKLDDYMARGLSTKAIAWSYVYSFPEKIFMILPAAVLFATVFLLGALAFYALCELFPKMLFRLYPNRLCLLFSRLFSVLHFFLRPVVALLRWLSTGLLRWSDGQTFQPKVFGTREELRVLMQDSAQELSSEERGMINRVLDLQNLTVRQITTPLSKTVTVTAQTSVNEILALAQEYGFNRLPVWKTEGSRRRIVGLLSVWSLLYQEKLDERKTAGDFVKPALYLDDETRLEVALRQMQRTGQRLAIVLARDRTELGIVSLQDILQVIFGEVRL